jgi:hypothetical protein
LDEREGSHFRDDGGNEEGEGGKANVTTEVDQGWKVAAVVQERANGLLPLKFITCAVAGLPEGELDCYFAVSIGEELGFAGAVGEPEPGYSCEGDGW